MHHTGVILDEASLAPADLDLSALLSSLDQWFRYAATTADETSARLAGASVALTNKVAIGAEEMRANSQLKLIAVMATGTDHVDLAAAQEYGITVCNAVGYSTPSVTQHTFALMLALATRLHQYRNAVRSGAWSESPFFCLLDYPVEELEGKTLGIIGYGALGKAVASVARSLGMTVQVAASLRGGKEDPTRLPLPELLSQSDIVSLHCPLTEQTRNLINRQTLQLMRRGAWLINTARGALVDEVALLEALQSGQLGAAGLDVLSQEPPPRNHPLLNADLPNLLISPHSAWGSRQSRQRLVDQMVKVINGFYGGEVLNRVV